MKNTTITTINNVAITIAQENQDTLVPIKPICEALGIDSKSQRDKIMQHPILSSVRVLSTSTGADGKQYEMLCLPLEYIFGWLFTINSCNVKAEAEEQLIEYQKECYEALYRYFFSRNKYLQECNTREAEILFEIDNLSECKRDADQKLRQRKQELEQLRHERLDNQLTLF